MSIAPTLPPPAMPMAQDFAPADPSVMPLPMADSTPVTKAMREYLKDSVQNAKKQTSDLHLRCQEAKEITGKTASSPSEDGSKALEFEIHTREAADQRDDMTGLLGDMVIRNGKLLRIEPGDDETTERAGVVNAAIDWELEHSNAKAETKRGLRCFTTYPFAGMESYREFKDGYTCYGIRNINPHCFAVSDIGRSGKNQFSVHKLHFFTKREMRAAGFRNLEKLTKADGAGENKILADGTTTKTDSKGTETYRVWESWVAPPFMEWATEGIVPKFAASALLSWINEWELPVPYFASKSEDGKFFLFDSANLLRVFHHEGEQLKITPNYLINPAAFPQKTTSFHPPTDDSFAGESFMERSQDCYEAQHHLVNAWWQNMVMVGNQSMFVSTRSSVPPNELQKIYKPRGIVMFSGNESPEQLFVPFKPQSIAQDIMPGIQFFQAKIEQAGVNDVMRGMSRARTATANQNDNVRGQMQVNESGSLFVEECLLPVLKDLRDMIVADYGPEEWFRVVGEDGALMVNQPPMTDSLTIDRHFRIYPVASFEYMNQQAKIAELINIANIAAPVVPPDMTMRIIKVVLDNTRLDRAQIEYIEGNSGGYTDILDEMEAMKADPYVNITVNPTDDHEACLIAVEMTEAGNPSLGEPPVPRFSQYPSVKKYVKAHLIAMQVLMQQQAMMQQGEQEGPPPANGRVPKGNPRQIPKEGVPQNPLAMIRSSAQGSSPSDNSRQPGMTGRAAPVVG